MDISVVGTFAYGVLLVLLGFNALILVHEFGHFIVARLCGVRCDKFYIWFDFWGLRFFKFKWGDTEYGLGLFPLGGYVTMYGQVDDPGQLRAEIEKARLQSDEQNPSDSSSDAAGITAAPNTPPTFPSDCYLSKSVPQRLAIIVAGVVMNFLFAIVCAAGAYWIGVQELVPAVGNVISGSPAWQAGLQSGDKIIAIDGDPARSFGDIPEKMIQGNKTVRLSVERQKESPEKELLQIDVSPRKRPADLLPSVGVSTLPTLDVYSGPDGSVYPQWEKYFFPETLKVLNKNKGKKGFDKNPLRIEKVDGLLVKNYAEYQKAQLQKIGQTMTCTFRAGDSDPIDVMIPFIPMREIPLRFKMGTITSVLSGSDAEKQEIKEGDTLVSIDGISDFDPLKLPQIILRKVNEGQKTIEAVVKNSLGAERSLSIELQPIVALADLGGNSMRDPLCSTALGLAWSVEPVVAEVFESSLFPDEPIPAVGDKVVSVEILNRKKIGNKNSFSEETDEGLFFPSIGSSTLDGKVDVPYIFGFVLQESKPQEPENMGDVEKQIGVRLILEDVEGKTKIVQIPTLESKDWFQSDRGFVLDMEMFISKANSVGEAFSMGFAKTVDFSMLVYKSVNSLVNGTVSPRALNGPVGIVKYMYLVALGGSSVYLMFLCLVGANLAIVNLLPIPPLDGGHVLFLLYEGIFRCQPNEIVQVILSYFGLFLIILLLVWTVSLDLTCITRT